MRRIIVVLAALCGLLTVSGTALAAGPPVNVTPPSIYVNGGLFYPNLVVPANPGTWTGGLTKPYQWQWRLGTTASGPWASIPGATTSVYTIARSDVGSYLDVTVGATNAYGTTTVASPAYLVRPTPSGMKARSVRPPYSKGAAPRGNKFGTMMVPHVSGGSATAIANSYTYAHCQADFPDGCVWYSGAGCSSTGGGSWYCAQEVEVITSVRKTGNVYAWYWFWQNINNGGGVYASGHTPA